MGCALELNFPPPLLQLQSCNRKNRKVYRQTSASKTGIALRTGSARERAAAASVLRAWPSLCRRDKPAISLRGWRVVYFSEASREPLRGDFLQPAGETAVAAINFCFQLIAREANLLGVDDYNVIPTIKVRGEIRLIFSDEYSRHSCRQPPEYLSRGIHHNPIGGLHEAFRFPAPRYMRRHLLCHTFPSVDKL